MNNEINQILSVQIFCLFQSILIGLTKFNWDLLEICPFESLIEVIWSYINIVKLPSKWLFTSKSRAWNICCFIKYTTIFYWKFEIHHGFFFFWNIVIRFFVAWMIQKFWTKIINYKFHFGLGLICYLFFLSFPWLIDVILWYYIVYSDIMLFYYVAYFG